MTRKSILRALLSVALLLPALAGCSGDPNAVNPKCFVEPETAQYVCIEADNT